MTEPVEIILKHWNWIMLSVCTQMAPAHVSVCVMWVGDAMNSRLCKHKLILVSENLLSIKFQNDTFCKLKKAADWANFLPKSTLSASVEEIIPP